MSSVFRGFISIFGSKLASLILSLVITPILVRVLGSSLYGDYAFLMSIFGISIIIVNAGIFDGVRKYMTEQREESLWKEHVFGFYSRVAALFAVSGLFVFCLLAWSGVPGLAFGEGFNIYFFFVGVFILFRQIYSLTRGGLMGLRLEDRSEPLKIMRKVLFGLFGVSLALMNKGVVGVLLGHIIANAFIGVVSIYFISKKLNIREILKLTPSGLPRRELLSFNSMSVVLILLTASLYHVDILLLRSISGSQQTGYYKSALVIAEFLWFVPNALQTVLLHSSSELWSENKTEKVTNLIARITRYNLSLTVLLSLGLGALASDFIPLYFGAEFESAVQPLLILLPGTLGFAIARPIFSVGQGKGELRKLIVATGSAAVLNLVLNVVLIPQYGMAGAAAATSVSYGSMLIFHIMAARSIGFDPIADVRLVRITVAAAFTAVAIIPLSFRIQSGVMSLLVVPPVGFVIYSILVVNLGIISRDELLALADQLPVPISRYIRWN